MWPGNTGLGGLSRRSGAERPALQHSEVAHQPRGSNVERGRELQDDRQGRNTVPTLMKPAYVALTLDSSASAFCVSHASPQTPHHCAKLHSAQLPPPLPHYRRPSRRGGACGKRELLVSALASPAPSIAVNMSSHTFARPASGWRGMGLNTGTVSRSRLKDHRLVLTVFQMGHWQSTE